MPAGLEAGEFPPWRGDAVRARRIREGHHAVGVADIECVAQQRHAERLVQSLHENFALFGDAVAIGVAQQRDAVRADAEGGGTSHRRLHRVAEHVPDGTCDLGRLGNEDVAIGQHVDPARMFETGRKRIDLEPRRRHRRLPVGPPSGRRHLERRDGALRLRRRDRRSAAPGRLMRGALQPAPQRAQRRRSARLFARKCRTSSCHSPVDRAHTIRHQGGGVHNRHCQPTGRAIAPPDGRLKQSISPRKEGVDLFAGCASSSPSPREAVGRGRGWGVLQQIRAILAPIRPPTPDPSPPRARARGGRGVVVHDFAISPNAFFARCSFIPALSELRAQGMPGARCARSRVCNGRVERTRA